MPVADSKEALDPRLRPKKSLPTTNSPSAAATKASNGSTSNASATQPIQGPITTLTSSRATTPLPTSQALGLYNVPTGPRSNIERAPTAPPATTTTTNSTSLANMARNPTPPPASHSNAPEWSHADYISLYRAIASCIPLDKHAEEITAAFNARSGMKRSHEDIIAHAADLQQRPRVGRAGSGGRSVTPQSVRGSALASMGEREKERKSRDGGQKKAAASEGAKVLVEGVDQNGTAAGANEDDSAATIINPPDSAAAAASSSSSASPSPNANKKRNTPGAADSTSPNGSDEQQQQHESAQVGQGGGAALILEANHKRLKIEVAPSKSKVFYQPGDGSVRIEFA